jgi:hypothetical protein
MRASVPYKTAIRHPPRRDTGAPHREIKFPISSRRLIIKANQGTLETLRNYILRTGDLRTVRMNKLLDLLIA